MKYNFLKPVERNRWSDIAGVCLSTICIVHCVIMPVLLLPFMLGSLLVNERHDIVHQLAIHEIIFVFTLIFGVTSIYMASRRGQLKPVMCLTVGLVAVAVAEFFLHDLMALRLPGTLCVVGGHLWAMRGRGTSCRTGQ